MRIEYYLPEKIFSNADLESEFPDWNAAKVEEKVGIRERHIVGPNETALDLALKASEKLLAAEDRKQVENDVFRRNIGSSFSCKIQFDGCRNLEPDKPFSPGSCNVLVAHALAK